MSSSRHRRPEPLARHLENHDKKQKNPPIRWIFFVCQIENFVYNNNMIDSKFVLAEFEKMYPNPHCELNFENNYQLIVAVILSAQCTDKRVNMVTPALFEKYPTIKSLSEANVHEVEDIIKSCGLYQAKAKNLIAMSKKSC